MAIQGTNSPSLDPVEAWDIQDGEPAHWYTRFLDYYLAQEPPRSLNEAYRRWYAEVKGKPEQDDAEQADAEARDGTPSATKGRKPTSAAPGQWKKISAAWNWISRGEAYDLHVLREEARQEERRRLEARRARRRLIEKLHGKVEAAADLVKPKNIEPQSLSSLARTVLAQSRAEYDDEPAQRVHQSGTIGVVTVSATDLSDLSEEELDERIAQFAAIAAAIAQSEGTRDGRLPRLPAGKDTPGETAGRDGRRDGAPL